MFWQITTTRCVRSSVRHIVRWLTPLYLIGSYDHFCFFDHISNSTKTQDDFAFFVFFTFKSLFLVSYSANHPFNFDFLGWKRLLLADAPRQAINALTLYAVYTMKRDPKLHFYEVTQYFAGNTMSTTALVLTALFTVLVCAGSLLLLVIAGICYIPLLLHIRGNLKVCELGHNATFSSSLYRNIVATRSTSVSVIS